MKQQASTSRERPSQIAAAHIATLSEESRTGVGKIDSMKRNIRNAKRRALPKEPASLSDLTIEGEWAETSSGQEFFVHDSGCDSTSRVIVFASHVGLQQLALQSEWYMDGTFSVAPKMFKQLYIIRAICNNPCSL